MKNKAKQLLESFILQVVEDMRKVEPLFPNDEVHQAFWMGDKKTKNIKDKKPKTASLSLDSELETESSKKKIKRIN